VTHEFSVACSASISSDIPREREHIMSEDTSKHKAVDSRIPDPEVRVDSPQSKTRRYHTSKYKLRILREADACKDKSGGLGALLRREGLYSSHISAWRRDRDEGRLSATTETRRGRKSDLSEIEAENLKLRRELAALKTERDHGLKLIEAQKKIAEIFAINRETSLPKGRQKKS